MQFSAVLFTEFTYIKSFLGRFNLHGLAVPVHCNTAAHKLFITMIDEFRLLSHALQNHSCRTLCPTAHSRVDQLCA